MKERQPINFNERRIAHLRVTESRLLGELAEVRMEIQRLQRGQQPNDLSGVISPPRLRDSQPIPRPYQSSDDVYWRRSTNFDQTRAEQANQQSDVTNR